MKANRSQEYECGNSNVLLVLNLKRGDEYNRLKGIKEEAELRCTDDGGFSWPVLLAVAL